MVVTRRQVARTNAEREGCCEMQESGATIAFFDDHGRLAELTSQSLTLSSLQ